jgi:hypothetical protein
MGSAWNFASPCPLAPINSPVKPGVGHTIDRL